MGSRLAEVSRRLWRDDEGQDLAEYGIALAVITGAVVLLAMFIGLSVFYLWEDAEVRISSGLGGS